MKKLQLALQINNLNKTYKDGTSALKSINFEVPKGDFFGLLGPNGAGKTTTIEIITSITNKTSGKVFINDVDIDHDFSLARKKLGFVPQELNFNLFETPIQIILKQAGYYGIIKKEAYSRAEYLLKKLRLWNKKNTQCKNLSGGMKRRLMIARALIHEPELLLLDEPTAGVDVELRREMLDFVKEINTLGTTIILTTHYLEEAESLCNNVAILYEGEIIRKSSVKDLIKTLDTEIFILNLENDLQIEPNIPKYKCTLIDHNTLAVELHRTQNLNDLFNQLSGLGITVSSLKNKANRLEEYFIKLTDKST
ncbi:MAG: ABC transporter ATP-binding protein [Legionellales bacterium]|nr:ABC transporter ATP-binding protein [Legionellales bacterium]